MLNSEDEGGVAVTKASPAPPGNGGGGGNQPTAADNNKPTTGKNKAGDPKPADTKPPESLDQAIKRMFSEGWNGRQVHDQIKKWHPGWSEYQIDQAMMRAPKSDKPTPVSPNKPKPDNSHGGGIKELVHDFHQAVRDIKGMPKGTARLLKDLSVILASNPENAVYGGSMPSEKQRTKALKDLKASGKQMAETLRHPMRDPFATALFLAPIGKGLLTGEHFAALDASYQQALRRLTPKQQALLKNVEDSKSFRYTAEQRNAVLKAYGKLGDEGQKFHSTKEHVSGGRPAEGDRSNTRGVMGIGEKVAKKLGYSAKNAKIVYYALEPHDIGKGYGSIPELVKAPRSLSRGEQEYLTRGHVAAGMRMLDELGIHDPNIRAVLDQHHGLRNAARDTGEMHPISKIAQVADIYDALVRSRPYPRELRADDAKLGIKLKEGQTYFEKKDALKIMGGMAKSGVIDPKALDALKRVVNPFPSNSTALLVPISAASSNLKKKK